MTPMQLRQALQQAVTALQGSGGRIYIAPQNSDTEAQLYVSGEQPVLLSKGKKTTAAIPLEEHPNWRTWFKKAMQAEGEIQPWAIGYASPKGIAESNANLLPSNLERAFKPTNIKSILTIRLEHRQQILGYLSIFRQGVDIETIWAKRPDRDDPRNQFPRQSFETWRELQQNKARQWESREIEFIGRFAPSILL
jgi:hypothetical protein